METEAKKNNYGFITTFSIIFAGVVGMGIFFKGAVVMDLTQSAMLMIMAWILISFVAMSLAYAYIEISSSTVQGDSKEQGSLYRWSSLFFNKRVGSFIGIFFCFFYLPLNLIALALLSSRMLINLFVGVGGEATQFIVDPVTGAVVEYDLSDYWATQNTGAQRLYILLVYFVAMMVIFFYIAVNAFGTRFSKILQSFGTIFKLVSIIGIIGVLAAGVFFITPANPSPDAIPGGESFKGDDPSYTGFFLALPAVMFSFDAFVQTGTLQSDTKNKNTFSRALISVMSIVTILYLLIIVFSGLIRDASGYDLPGLVSTILPGNSFKIFLLILITVSGITATNSSSIVLGRTLSNLADHKEILNPKDNLQYQDKKTGAYTYSYRLVLSVLVFYLIIFLALDISLFPYSSRGATWEMKEGELIYVNSVDVRAVAANIEICSTDIITMLMYGVYGLVVFGGIKNRKSNKVKVDKSKAFLPVAYFAVSLLGIIFVLYFISVPINFIGENGAKKYNASFGTVYALPIQVLLLVATYLIWEAFDWYFHVPGNKEKLEAKIASMKKQFKDYVTLIEEKVNDLKDKVNEKADKVKEKVGFNKKKPNNVDTEKEKLISKILNKSRVPYLLDNYNLYALEVETKIYKQIWKPQQY